MAAEVERLMAGHGHKAKEPGVKGGTHLRGVEVHRLDTVRPGCEFLL
jgi:hypothetical protein